MRDSGVLDQPSTSKNKVPGGGLFQRKRGSKPVGTGFAHLGPIGFSLLLAAALLVALGGIRAWDPPPVEILRLQSFDLYQRLAPRQSGPLLVTIVDIDEDSLSEIGQWPWPRDQLAVLVRRIFEAGAVVVAFDVLFPEPDRMSPPLLADRLSGLEPSALQALRRMPTHEDIFSAAIRNKRVVLARAAVLEPMKKARKAPAVRIVKTAFARIGGDPRNFLLSYPAMVRNLPELETAAHGLGNITLSPDLDGVARRVPLVVNVAGELLPSLTMEMLRVATGQSAIAIKTDDAGIRSVIVAGIAIRTDRQGRKWVHFAPSDPRRYVPAAEVLAGRAPPDRFKGKLVLIGTSATGLKDIKITPVSPAMPGVEIHAQLLENLLARTGLTRPNFMLAAELVLLGFICIAIALVVPFVSALLALGAAGLVVAGIVGGSWYLYAWQNLLIDASFPLVGFTLVYGLLTYLKYIREETERKQVRDAFSHYVSPALIDQLADHPEQFKLGGETRPMTILFSDIRGFTSLAERYEAEELTVLVNRTLGYMTDVVLHYFGTIDKYIGDCLMAFWNAPVDDPDHARHACAAALEIINHIDDLNAQIREDFRDASSVPPTIVIGLGVNTGVCVVGNMGSEYRFNYSVIGDTVNLSARLEGQTKTYGCPIVIGEDTVEQAADYAFLELDLVRVIGKARATRVFALLGEPAIREQADFIRLEDSQDAMLSAYRSRDWSEALRCLDACRVLGKHYPLGDFYDLYAARIAEFERTPPPSDWDAVYDADTK